VNDNHLSLQAENQSMVAVAAQLQQRCEELKSVDTQTHLKFIEVFKKFKDLESDMDKSYSKLDARIHALKNDHLLATNKLDGKLMYVEQLNN
jgi:transcriptional regulator NrdR family protein